MSESIKKEISIFIENFDRNKYDHCFTWYERLISVLDKISIETDMNITISTSNMENSLASKNANIHLYFIPKNISAVRTYFVFGQISYISKSIDNKVWIWFEDSGSATNQLREADKDYILNLLSRKNISLISNGFNDFKNEILKFRSKNNN